MTTLSDEAMMISSGSEDMKDSEKVMNEKPSSAPSTIPEKKRRGRKPKYSSPEERVEAQRVNALKYYYRKKAKVEALKENEINRKEATIIEVKVSTLSPKLGKIDEVVRYKVLMNGELLKIQE